MWSAGKVGTSSVHAAASSCCVVSCARSFSGIDFEVRSAISQ